MTRAAPQRADEPGGEAAGEDREKPPGNRRRAECRRCEAREETEPGRQDVELAEREHDEERDEPEPARAFAAAERRGGSEQHVGASDDQRAASHLLHRRKLASRLRTPLP